MNIYITKEFKEILESPDRYINLGKFKLGAYSQSVSDFSKITWKYMNQIDYGRSPTDGYYQFNSIISDESEMILNFDIPDYDIGMLDQSYYKLIYCIYTDMQTSDKGLAFLLISDYQKTGTVVDISPLRLSRSRNIITIPDFTYQCSLDLDMSDDTRFLEGSGVGDYCNIYTALDMDQTEKNKMYVSKSSFDSYRLEKRSEDSYDHTETTFINKFGIKIY